ncbi:Serine/threonine-protein kinase ksg1 [Cyberlindnera fabianii]|uniref:non-specific serine/threonine protein kinase n=1 Tax=Cyberlindnera fabianii TaxID=36022 RepID=A0A1V2L0T3_CYBFA|nr:Serine/threonine-protein kinase ksg1 [Cyberlindnera fabianii]
MSGRKTPQDFQFGSRLGEGSYSQVFKGVDISTRKVFAIKVLSKKHIVKEKKIKYVNIEKITLNRLGRVIHRDLKPENILLNSDMKLMITDFGAAKILELDESGNLTDHDEAFAKGSFVGTAEYVSPELLKHNKCGFESDIWQLVVSFINSLLVYHLLKARQNMPRLRRLFIYNINGQISLYQNLSKTSFQNSYLIGMIKQRFGQYHHQKIDHYRPIVEQQLHNTTQGINRIMIQKKLPAATVKKQLLNNTINQIRDDTGANYLYNGASDGRKPVSSPQLTPPIKKPNGSPTSNPSISPIRPRLPQVQPHQRSPIPQQQQQHQHQFNPRVNQQHSPLSQQKPAIPGPQRPIGPIGQSPTTRNVKVATNIPPQQVQQSPTRLREAVVMSQSQQAPSAPIKKTTTVTTDAPVVPPKTFVTTRSTSTPSVKTKATPVVPVKKATTAPAPTKTITPQTTSKSNSKPPQISLPPKPKSQPPQSQPPRPQQPTVVTKTNNMTPTTSPKKTYSSNFKTLDSNGVITGPTQVLNRLAKDEGIVKLDFINLSSLDLSSLRTFDPTSRLSQLGKSGGLDDVLIHEIISKNEKSLEQDMKRVVLVITDLGNLLLFDCVKIQELRFNMAIDLTDKLFAMYDYEFSEFDQNKGAIEIKEELKEFTTIFIIITTNWKHFRWKYKTNNTNNVNKYTYIQKGF